jgi:hypothetical protein
MKKAGRHGNKIFDFMRDFCFVLIIQGWCINGWFGGFSRKQEKKQLISRELLPGD